MSWAMDPDFELLLSSPENECRHGRCPGDTSARCGCWADLEGVEPIKLADARRTMVPTVFTLAPRPAQDVLALIAKEAA